MPGNRTLLSSGTQAYSLPTSMSLAHPTFGEMRFGGMGEKLGEAQHMHLARKRLTQLIDIRTWFSVWKLRVIISPSLCAASIEIVWGGILSDWRIVINGEGLVEPACMNALSSVALPSVHTISLSFRAERPSELSWSSPIILADEQRPRKDTELTLQHIGSQPKARTCTKVSHVRRFLFPWQHNVSLSTVQFNSYFLTLTLCHWALGF